MRRSTKRKLTVAAILLLIVGLVLVIFRSQIRESFSGLGGNDYSGPGSGNVVVVVPEGATGEEIIRDLVDKGVVKDYRFTLKLATERNTVFYPGYYSLRSKMTASQALAALSDASGASSHRVVIREGLRISALLETLAKETALPLRDFTTAAANLADFEVGAGAPSLEGYLFPATYNFSPGQDAKAILQQMNQRMVEELDSLGVKRADWHRVLTLAGLVQAEARLKPDFYKVSRVFLNRIAKGMKLQSDATVSYGVGGSTVNTTAAERAANNGYNTYLHEGLPIGPISAPGRTAIEAALRPAKGDWLYFCAVNLQTGETKFSKTFAEHERAVAQWRAWMKENPGYD